MSQNLAYRIAIVQWATADGIAEIICDELSELGHEVTYIQPRPAQIFHNPDVIFSYGPYGSFLTIPSLLARTPLEQRPVFVHWNTEGIPDMRLPWFITRFISSWRSWVGRLALQPDQLSQLLARTRPVQWVNAHMHRFRYVGDYYYAYRRGWLDVFADSSAIYGQLHNKHGLPTIFAPWGATPRWSADLDLERDIDVLWMGNRNDKRRHVLLNRICGELRSHGVNVHVADGKENPFIFGDERTEYLNRAKISLNITRTWYDDNFSRFAIAAPNRSLIVSEPVLPHCHYYRPGIHYVSAPIDQLTRTILYYLGHEDERLRIVEQAYQLVTTQLTFQNSISDIMQAVDTVWQTTRSKKTLPADHKTLPGSICSLRSARSIE